MLNRREFLGVGAAFAVSLAGASGHRCRESRFSRRYAPHLGMFRHHAGSDPIDQIKFLADEGFGALEDSGLRAKPPGLQARMGDELARRGMSMGLFVGLADFGRPTFASGCVELRRGLLRELRSAVETARRVGGRYLAVVPGKSVPESSPVRSSFATPLRRCGSAPTFASRTASCCYWSRSIMDRIHRGSFCARRTRQPNCAGRVGRPSCRLLFDVYQQSVAGENVPRLLTETSDVLGYVQLADSPGRKEPGTGDIDFRHLFGVLDAIGYCGVLGMEHGNLLPGRGERGP